MSRKHVPEGQGFLDLTRSKGIGDHASGTQERAKALNELPPLASAPASETPTIVPPQAELVFEKPRLVQDPEPEGANDAGGFRNKPRSAEDRRRDQENRKAHRNRDKKKTVWG